MSFDRPGTPKAGRELDSEAEAAPEKEGVEVTDHQVDPPDHPGEKSAGPQPNPPRR
ncbi:hypothetical protein ACFCV3_08250 [Kribbella sp. NPDC056345]|uniref:hypothetical protein n=1 Tax=Kribbella sp. NPDC056345 TaxID=3345789 RepID=UPI0035DDF206